MNTQDNIIPNEIEFFKEDKWLSVALKRYGIDNIPSNVVIEKTITGIGATTMELKAKRNSIIIEPNVSVLLSKAEKGMLPVYEMAKEKTIKKYLSSKSIQYKKILTTPEGFWKIIKAASESNINIYDEYFCLFDEWERLIQDFEYREKIVAPINDFFEFKNKAFVSATPIKYCYEEFQTRGFKIMTVKPQFPYQKNIELIVSNDFESDVKEKFKSLQESKCVCVFYNSISGITALISALKIKSQSKIFCSLQSTKQLKADGYDVNYKLVYPFAKYNFFTSSFFSALDIDIREKADIVILTDLNKAMHSMIDPSTETIQIQGRFRHVFEDETTYNSLTHITNIEPNLEVMTYDQAYEMIKKVRDNFDLLYDKMTEETDPICKTAIEKDLKSLSYNKYIYYNHELNIFSVSNTFNEERIKGYYTSVESFLKGYECSGYFLGTCYFDDETKEEKAKEFYSESSNKTPKALMKSIVNDLKYLPEDQFENSKNTWLKWGDNKFILDTELAFEAYKIFGEEVFIKRKFNKALIQKELDKHNDEIARKSKDVVQEMVEIMALNTRIDKNTIKKDLQKIYKKFGITKTVSQQTIEDYYEVIPYNSDKPASYLLKALKPEFNQCEC